MTRSQEECLLQIVDSLLYTVSLHKITVASMDVIYIPGNINKRWNLKTIIGSKDVCRTNIQFLGNKTKIWEEYT